MLSQRLFLIAGLLLVFVFWLMCVSQHSVFAQAPVVALTKGPGFHWFGYYDKFQFDPTDRYVLGMKVDFEHRSPTKDDIIKIGMVDLQNNNRWIELGESRAWCWQQGCMLQWRPGSNDEVLWNDREGDRFVCRVLNVNTKKMRTLPHPVYHVSPDGKRALGTEFSRINDQRPGYGYQGVADPYRNENAPKSTGIYLMELDSGEMEYIISYADIERIRFNGQAAPGKLHVNHIQWSPDGKRFMFLNRINGNRDTIAYTANPDGTDIRLLGTKSSHFEWRDPKHVLIWSDGAYRLHTDDGTGKSKIVLEADNGHNSYLKNKDWFVTDTYPQKETRNQTLYLYHVPTGKKIELGRFHSPKDYRGEWRCDTHPRISRDGTKIVIDSTHGGQGRQLYMIDISKILVDHKSN